jgi:hypothetical protein
MMSIFRFLCVCSIFFSSKVYSAEYQDFSHVRNPFICIENKSDGSVYNPIVVEGIVYTGTKRSAAVLRCGTVRSIVSRGQKFMGYQLIVIGKKFVVLASNKQRLKLSLE